MQFSIIVQLVRNVWGCYKGWDCKDDPKSQNIMIWSLIFGSAFNRVFWCFTKWLRTKIDNEPWMQGNGLNKFLTIVFS